MPPSRSPRPVSVALMVLPESTPAALYGLYEVVTSVGEMWSAITGDPPSGAVLLAEAGLLDGQEATSHWSVKALFREYFPSVRPRPEPILCSTGPDQRIVTGGGASAWEDLALYVVARWCGEAEAVRMAKLFLFGDRSEGLLPFAALARPRRHGRHRAPGGLRGPRLLPAPVQTPHRRHPSALPPALPGHGQGSGVTVRDAPAPNAGHSAHVGGRSGAADSAHAVCYLLHLALALVSPVDTAIAAMPVERLRRWERHVPGGKGRKGRKRKGKGV